MAQGKVLEATVLGTIIMEEAKKGRLIIVGVSTRELNVNLEGNVNS